MTSVFALAPETPVPVVPVVVIEDAADAVPLARALVTGGLPLIEVTLRTPAAPLGVDQRPGDLRTTDVQRSVHHPPNLSRTV